MDKRTKISSSKPLKKGSAGDAAKTDAAVVAALTATQLELAVERYLHVHPRYFVYTGIKIQADLWRMNYDGKQFRGWKGTEH